MSNGRAFAVLFLCGRSGVLGGRMIGRETSALQQVRQVFEFGRSLHPNFADLRSHHDMSLDELLSDFDCFADESKCGSDDSGAGLSGASFMVSNSKRFFAKTVDLRESPFLENMISDYVTYMTDHPASLMSVIFTAFKLDKWKPCIGSNCWIIMNNALSKKFHKTTIGGKFDLKGVWGRHDPQERGRKLPWDEPDGLEEQFMESGIFLTPARGRQLLEQLGNDTKFLEEQHMMDYSLLVQVEELGQCDDKALATICQKMELDRSSRTADASKNKCPVDHSLAGHQPGHSEAPTFLFDDHSGYAVGVRGNVLYSYSIGLIDFLASFHLYQMAGWWQANIEGKSDENMELIEPAAYRERFLAYVRSKVISQGISSTSVRDPTCECDDFHRRQTFGDGPPACIAAPSA